MKISFDNGYLRNDGNFKIAGFADEVVGQIRIQGKQGEQEQIIRLLDMLENNFRMYQYRKDNGINFGTEDLFYWSNGDGLYFTLTLKANTLEEHNILVKKVLDIINTEFNNTSFVVVLQMDNRKDWNKINNYLKQDFDINNLPVKILSKFMSDLCYCGREYSKESAKKLYALSEQYISKYLDKKVRWNSGLIEMIGVIRKLESGYAFFKQRATKTYYPISLSNIESLEIL